MSLSLSLRELRKLLISMMRYPIVLFSSYSPRRRRCLPYSSFLILLPQSNQISITWNTSFRLIQYNYLFLVINRLCRLFQSIEYILLVSSLLVFFFLQREKERDIIYLFIQKYITFLTWLRQKWIYKVLICWFWKCHIFYIKNIYFSKN